jgi:Uma2 family endonuclease
MATLHWTSKDLKRLPDDGQRYEIVDGELYVSKQPDMQHQFAETLIWEQLQLWSRHTKTGRAYVTPGLIFAEDSDVVPDVVWISNKRLAIAQHPDGHLHGAPELAVEFLSPGSTNERRDREAKRSLYSCQGVLEYWVVNWQEQSVAVYRQHETELQLIQTLFSNDSVQSPYLPGFNCKVSQFFNDQE